MNWKLIVLGGLAMYVVMFAISMATGPIIHEGVLEPIYVAHQEFWRPELRQDPPDLAALMPRWITTGLLTTFVMAAVFGAVRPAFAGPGWKKGLKFGFVLAVLSGCFAAGWSGLFDLPDSLWVWWSAEAFAYYLAGGAVLGWVGERFP